MYTNLIMSDNNDCSICHEDMSDNLFKTSCNHTFHTECINTWLRTKLACPICRKGFPPPKPVIKCHKCNCDDLTKMARFSDTAFGQIYGDTMICNLIKNHNHRHDVTYHYCTQCINKDGGQGETCPSPSRLNGSDSVKYICFKSLIDPTKYYFLKERALNNYSKSSTLSDFKRLKMSHNTDFIDYIKSKMNYVREIVIVEQARALRSKGHVIERKIELLNNHHVLLNELNV